MNKLLICLAFVFGCTAPIVKEPFYSTSACDRTKRTLREIADRTIEEIERQINDKCDKGEYSLQHCFNGRLTLYRDHFIKLGYKVEVLPTLVLGSGGCVDISWECG